MKRTLVGSGAVILICGVLWVRHCSGPRPVLVSSRMRGAVAEVVVRNEGGGEGEIQVDFRARPGDGGAPLLHSEKASLRAHETARIEARIDGALGDERLDVEVDYPPR